MGIRVQKCECNECGEEFWVSIEWMDKDELIEHIKDTHCPECGSDNWFITDYSKI